MTTTYPTVTITVSGSGSTATVSDDTPASALHMLYVQAVKGDQRKQWVVFPPAIAALGVPENRVPPTTQNLLLSRVQEFKGNRSKWFHNRINTGQTYLTEQMKHFEADGWALGGVVVVPLETDDYVSAWEGNTPHKAMRAIDRALKPLGISVK